jgi:parallel beta-helix repeat protein
VEGSLVVSGTAQKPVEFRGVEHGFGVWMGIRLSKVKDTTIKYARVFDAEIGISIVKSKPTLLGCVVANNVTGLHAGDYGAGSHPALEDCVFSFNEKHGVSLSGSGATITSCTISRNGGWGIFGEYYASPAVKASVITANGGGGLYCRRYECKVSVAGSVLAGNAEVDVRNESSLDWDLRGNYWGPALTKVLKGGQTAPPNVAGKARLDGFLEKMPENCGASMREVNGQKLW